MRFRDFWAEHLASYGLEFSEKAYGLPTGGGHWLHYRWPDVGELAEIRAAREVYRKGLGAVGIDAAEGAPDDSERRTCAAYWKTPTVSWDGKVMMCSVDAQQTMKAGDVSLDSLTELWWKGQRMQQVRDQVGREDFVGLNLCRGCNHPYSPNSPSMKGEELEAWFQNV